MSARRPPRSSPRRLAVWGLPLVLVTLATAVLLGSPAAMPSDAARGGSASSAPVDEEGPWVCPPCGADCHAATYAAAGSCATCGMTLVPEASVPLVVFLLYEGVDLASWSGAMSVFATSDEVFVRTVSDTDDPIRCGDVLTVVPDRALADQPPPDVLVLPSGFARVWDDDLFMDWIAEAAEGADHVLAVGSGGLIAARAGLLPGGELAIGSRYGSFVAEVAPEHAVAAEASVVADGEVLSVRDAAAALEASYGLLGELVGPEVAERTAARLGHER